MLSFLPGIFQIRTFLKVYGAELRLLLEKNNTHHPSSLVAAPRIGLEYPFPLAPPFKGYWMSTNKQHLSLPPALSPRA